MGKLKQKMIEEMDMARECGDLHGDGVMFTCHPTDHLHWSEITRFIYRLRDYYELYGREIIEVNSYHNSGHDLMSNTQTKPAENGIEIKWRESNADTI